MTRLARLVATAAVFATCWMTSSTVKAQQYAPFQRSFETNLFEPAMGNRQLFMVETARVPKHLGWGVGAFLGYQNSSMSVYLVDRNNNLQEDYPMVGSHITSSPVTTG
jgi:hypothetical protein